MTSDTNEGVSCSKLPIISSQHHKQSVDDGNGGDGDGDGDGDEQ